MADNTSLKRNWEQLLGTWALISLLHSVLLNHSGQWRDRRIRIPDAQNTYHLSSTYSTCNPDSAVIRPFGAEGAVYPVPFNGSTSLEGFYNNIDAGEGTGKLACLHRPAGTRHTVKRRPKHVQEVDRKLDRRTPSPGVTRTARQSHYGSRWVQFPSY